MPFLSLKPSEMGFLCPRKFPELCFQSLLRWNCFVSHKLARITVIIDSFLGQLKEETNNLKKKIVNPYRSYTRKRFVAHNRWAENPGWISWWTTMKYDIFLKNAICLGWWDALVASCFVWLLLRLCSVLMPTKSHGNEGFCWNVVAHQNEWSYSVAENTREICNLGKCKIDLWISPCTLDLQQTATAWNDWVF